MRRGKWNHWWNCSPHSLNFIKGKDGGEEPTLLSAPPGCCCENEKTLRGKLDLDFFLSQGSLRHSEVTIQTQAVTAPGTATTEAVWGFGVSYVHRQPVCSGQQGSWLPGDFHTKSRLDAILLDVTMTNCFPNVLPGHLFRFVTGPINFSVYGRLRQCAASRWPRLTAYHGPQVLFSSLFRVLTGMDVSVRHGRQMMTNPIRSIEYPGNCQGFFGFPTEVFYLVGAEERTFYLRLLHTLV